MDDSLGLPYYRLINVRWYLPFPYHRLINVIWLPFLKIKSLRTLPWKWKSLGYPLPENRKSPTFIFMFFDRYEFHIQALLLFIHGKLIIYQSSSLQEYLKTYILKLFFQTISSKKQNMFRKKVGLIFKCPDTQIWKNVF